MNRVDWCSDAWLVNMYSSFPMHALVKTSLLKYNNDKLPAIFLALLCYLSSFQFHTVLFVACHKLLLHYTLLAWLFLFPFGSACLIYCQHAFWLPNIEHVFLWLPCSLLAQGDVRLTLLCLLSCVFACHVILLSLRLLAQYFNSLCPCVSFSRLVFYSIHA